MTTDYKRLGKRGSYRLGRLRAQGIKVAPPPTPFRPSFARNYRRGAASGWFLGLVLGAAVIAGGALLGWWFVPFAAGLAAGLANRIGGWRLRTALPAVALMAVAGWGVPLWWQTLHGQPYGAVAREIAALGGLPGGAAAALALTLLVAVVQAVIGYWLGRALAPRPAED
jgi:hypothetical protein